MMSSETVAHTHERRVRRPGDAFVLNRHVISGGNADSRSRLTEVFVVRAACTQQF